MPILILYLILLLVAAVVIFLGAGAIMWVARWLGM